METQDADVLKNSNLSSGRLSEDETLFMTTKVSCKFLLLLLKRCTKRLLKVIT